MIKKITDNRSIKGHTAILRVDYNVPVKNGKITDTSRILASKDTIKYILKKQGRVIILAHLGRPEGKPNPEYSLKVVTKTLEKIFKQKIGFAKNFEEATNLIKTRKIVLFENIRFYPEEENNDANFAKKLSQLGKYYVNDGFSVSHRKHASVHAITKFIPAYAGFHLHEEFKVLHNLLSKPKPPFTLVCGGAKIDTKIGIIKMLISKYDNLVIGGALANTFLKAQGYEIGKSLVELDKITTAKSIIKKLEQTKKTIYLPTDCKVKTREGKAKNIPLSEVSATDSILDIGQKTVKTFSEIFKKSKTIVWNGPMGKSDEMEFAGGTKAIAKVLIQETQQGKKTILGGGDTVDSLNSFKINPNKFTYVSLSGGAMLEFLEGKKLPGLQALGAYNPK